MRRSLLAPALLTLLGLFTLPWAGGAAPAAAQTLADYDYEYLRLRGVGVDVGYIWPTKLKPTQQFSLRIDLGYLGPGVRIIPSISYWRSDFNSDELEHLRVQLDQQPGVNVDPGALGDIRWSDLSLSVDGHYVWNVPFGILTFVGVGAGLHAMNGQGAAIDDTLVEDLLDVIMAAVSGLGGVEAQATERLRIYAEGRYTAMNSVQYLSARGGVQFMLGTGQEDRVGGAVPAPGIGEGGLSR